MKRLAVCVIVTMLAAVAASLPLVLNAEFGQTPQGVQLSRVEQSSHYRDGQLHNQVLTPGYTGNKSTLATWWEFLVAKREDAQPAQPLPMVATNLAGLSPQQNTLVQLGHSPWYLQLVGQRILIDPIFNDYTAPFSFLNRALAGDYPWTAQTTSEINLLIISHDHYGHLDLATIEALMSEIKRVITPLDIGLHLRYWGIRNEVIEERDWSQSVRVTNSLIIHVLPAHRFSGCGVKHNQILWTSFMFETSEQNVYYSSDSGYGPHFKTIDGQFGSVNLATIENGQYDQDWRFIHMMLGEAAQTAADLHVKAVLPGHIGHFVLAKHTWDDPYKRLALASRHQDYRLLTPMLGEPVILSKPDQPFTAWRQQVTQ